jgi:hypothetical protein
MALQKCILVFGRSLNLAGIAASLKLQADLDVRYVDHHQHTARDVLAMFAPKAIIYDLTDPPADLDLALIGERPGTLLIGMDPSSDDVLVLSNQPAAVFSLSDLIELMRITDDAWKEGDREK